MAQAQDQDHAVTLTRFESAIHQNEDLKDAFVSGSTKLQFQIGDIIVRSKNENGWERKQGILNENHGYVAEPAKRTEIESAINNPVKGEDVEISLTDGMDVVGLLNNDDGATELTGLSLPDTIDGNLTMKLSFTKPDAYTACCKGSWMSIEFPQGVLESLKPNEKKLATLVKNPERTHILVTGIFRTSSDYVSFISKGDTENFDVEIDGLKDAAPGAVYEQLRDKINSKCPTSFEHKPPSFVPFFRGVQIQPQWLYNGVLSNRPPPSTTAATREGKPKTGKTYPQPCGVAVGQPVVKTQP